MAVASSCSSTGSSSLFKGRTPDGLHNFVAGYLRYLTHLEAYFLLAANPFPSFYPFDEKPYPVDLRDRPARAHRTAGRRSSASSWRSRRS